MSKLITSIALLTLIVFVSCDELNEGEEELIRCNKNQVYSTCIQRECRPLKCSQLGFPLDCPNENDKIKCEKGCICAVGYVKNKEGTCIGQDTCPEGCGDDVKAKTGCSNWCAQSCTTTNATVCTKECKVNGCSCKGKYLYDWTKGKCVSPEDCPPKCPKNEEYSTCIQGVCRALNCSQLGTQIPCVKIDPNYCKKGCICVQGYLRNNEGNCVLENQCQKCPKNQIYNTCPAIKCDAENCPLNRTSPLTCPIGIVCDPPRCTCPANMHRDRKTGYCILTQNCPPFKCDQEHEKYVSCPLKCPSDKCYDYLRNETCDAPLGTHIGIVVPCEPECRCDKGLYRNGKGYCVSPDQCCPKNEEYSNCTQSVRRPLKCSELGYPLARLNDKKGDCAKGCICVEGYVRDKTGKCIPQDTCPEGCGGDVNKKTGCSNWCMQSCAKGTFCILLCELNGCSCKDGYLHDPNTGKCVPPEKCSLQCTGPNEKYNRCAPTCPSQKCETVGIKFSCIKQPAPGDPDCKEGCRCIPGFYRDYRNICVSEKQCLSCNKSNQVYDSCSTTCPGNNCTDIGKQYKCAEQPVPGDPECKAACRCRTGFYKSPKNECISERDCKKYYPADASSDDAANEEEK